MNKQEAIGCIEKLIGELQKILSTENLKSKCIGKPERKSLYSEEASRIVQIQGIVYWIKEHFKIEEKDLK